LISTIVITFVSFFFIFFVSETVLKELPPLEDKSMSNSNIGERREGSRRHVPKKMDPNFVSDMYGKI
jgi:hypothetical protein